MNSREASVRILPAYESAVSNSHVIIYTPTLDRLWFILLTPRIMCPINKGRYETCSGPQEREDVARRINESMERFGLILSILKTLSLNVIPAVGDSDLRRGCERALTGIIASVSMIPPAEADGKPPGDEECRATGWLAGNQSLTLLDPDKLSLLAFLIDQLLPSPRHRIASAS